MKTPAGAASFDAEDLERRRAAARRLAFGLAAAVLAVYLAGFWFER